MKVLSDEEANETTYRGNTVSYIHAKMLAYKASINRLNDWIDKNTAHLERSTAVFEERYGKKCRECGNPCEGEEDFCCDSCAETYDIVLDQMDHPEGSDE